MQETKNSEECRLFVEFKAVFSICTEVRPICKFLIIGEPLRAVIQTYASEVLSVGNMLQQPERLKSFFEKIEKATNFHYIKKSQSKSSEYYTDLTNDVGNEYMLSRAGKDKINFYFAIYYWFHVFCKDSKYADQIDKAVLKKYEDDEHTQKAIENALKEIEQKIRLNPKQPIFAVEVKDTASAPLEQVAPARQANANNTGEGSEKNHELTPQERQKIVDQFEDIIKNKLVDIQIFVPVVCTESTPVSGAFYCRKEDQRLICDGLAYDFSFFVHEVCLEFRLEGGAIKIEKDYYDDEIIRIDYSRKGSDECWWISAENIDSSYPLKGSLLRLQNGRLFFVTFPNNQSDCVLSVKQIVGYNRIKIQCIERFSMKPEQANKQYLIKEMIETEMLEKLCFDPQDYHFSFKSQANEGID